MVSSLKRYGIALAGVVFHLMIGGVYAWSVFTKPIVRQTGWRESSVAFAFSLAIFFLGMSAAFMGRLVEKFGPSTVGTISSIFYGTGIALTGLAIHNRQLWLLYLAYGVIGGLGLGSGYVTPVSTIVRWFPDKRGLATGLAIMGFGFAALLTGPVALRLILTIGLVNAFYVLGLFYFVVMIITAQFIKKPQPHELPTVIAQNAARVSLTNQEMSASQAVRTRWFASLWFMFFINITTGIGLVSAASPMAQNMTVMTPATAAIMVGIIGLFNGFGRLAWATLSDYIGRPLTYSLIFVLDVVMLLILIIFKQPFIFALALCLLMSCYGAGFSVIPAYLGDVFSTKELGAIHGYVLTAWAAAGMVGPLLLSWTHQVLHNYYVTLIVFIIIDLLAMIVSLRIQKGFVTHRSTESA
ncbi:MAG: OFA family MFS transporter [[Lactobacillus] timonensis]|jgi:OFA family oxalate/formate antiporter-like MFS transporter|uniref:L-lactate MFS transporter n=1 Tax=[Lactobacillus] timonensis TaxID=1970790 RepID=UPI002357B616|nr:OFA family MFS transporter [[Lactobacillus] timonensis]MCI1926573.1 OFA family MFS transporter [[Lactobacillus] timonensis]MCI1957973.1 OFA family MFS transporter [[Lactobacillus] timonensis]MCI1970971.1 OFA family MFS transporter [[Lactobacillus] timonensis]MCI2007103.1 OFA family MFS transporter [[Lactobacillus] timonensis]